MTAPEHAVRPDLAAPSETLDVAHHIHAQRAALFAVCADPDVAHVDRRIGEVAGRQRTCVSTAQLRALGLKRGALAHRVRTGRLVPLHKGVLAVGSGVLPPLGREQAALLAVDGTILAAGSAGFVWGTFPAHPSGPVELLSPRNRRNRDGIVIHETSCLEPDEVRTHRGLLLTSPVRTAADLASRLSDGGLELLLAETLVKRLATEDELRSRGGRRIAKLLDQGPRLTRAETERALLRLVDGAGLPRPLTNQALAGFEVDAVWPHHRVALEVDGGTTHGHLLAMERDHRRDLAVQAAGYRTVRVTRSQLADEPLPVVAQLARVLA